MLLRFKGWVRRVAAGCASLSQVSRQAILGIIALACIILVVLCARGCVTSSFELVPATSVASAQEVELEQEHDMEEVSQAAPKTVSMIIVHVGGAVVNPGVYEVPEGSRLYSCVKAAGGCRDDANPDGVNMARLVFDGEHIVIPCVGEQVSDPGSVPATYGGLVSINSASVEELCVLDGIGEVLAQRIVTYRQKHGGFASLDQLKEVSGIGEKRYEAIKDAICL